MNYYSGNEPLSFEQSEAFKAWYAKYLSKFGSAKKIVPDSLEKESDKQAAKKALEEKPVEVSGKNPNYGYLDEHFAQNLYTTEVSEPEPFSPEELAKFDAAAKAAAEKSKGLAESLSNLKFEVSDHVPNDKIFVGNLDAIHSANMYVSTDGTGWKPLGYSKDGLQIPTEQPKHDQMRVSLHISGINWAKFPPTQLKKFVSHVETVKNVTTHAYCGLDPCFIHRPSDHHMRDWAKVWASTHGGFLFRACPHFHLHPDPDQLSWSDAQDVDLDAVFKHNCDGCCVEDDTDSSQFPF